VSPNEGERIVEELKDPACSLEKIYHQVSHKMVRPEYQITGFDHILSDEAE
jgi:hypothetical protein